MSGQVILYFDDQADALRFALAAGSVMAGDETHATGDLVQETARVTRIRLDAPRRSKQKRQVLPNALRDRSLPHRRDGRNRRLRPGRRPERD